jgi:hypothetical protein
MKDKDILKRERSLVSWELFLKKVLIFITCFAHD